jgi:hypothetical protein
VEVQVSQHCNKQPKTPRSAGAFFLGSWRNNHHKKVVTSGYCRVAARAPDRKEIATRLAPAA